MRGTGQSRKKAAAGFLLLALMCLFLAACGRAEEEPQALDSGLRVEESGEGLIIDGEGPIPARLIAQSHNRLSVEEEQIFRELEQELDKMVDIAGQMDQAISNESMNTENLVSNQSEE